MVDAELVLSLPERRLVRRGRRPPDRGPSPRRCRAVIYSIPPIVAALQRDVRPRVRRDADRRLRRLHARLPGRDRLQRRRRLRHRLLLHAVDRGVLVRAARDLRLRPRDRLLAVDRLGVRLRLRLRLGLGPRHDRRGLGLGRMGLGLRVGRMVRRMARRLLRRRVGRPRRRGLGPGLRALVHGQRLPLLGRRRAASRARAAATTRGPATPGTASRARRTTRRPARSPPASAARSATSTPATTPRAAAASRRTRRPARPSPRAAARSATPTPATRSPAGRPRSTTRTPATRRRSAASRPPTAAAPRGSATRPSGRPRAATTTRRTTATSTRTPATAGSRRARAQRLVERQRPGQDAAALEGELGALDRPAALRQLPVQRRRLAQPEQLGQRQPANDVAPDRRGAAGARRR